MKKIDWIKKISSRRFWLCVAGFVTALLIAFNVGQNTISQITAIIGAFGTLIIYIFSESTVDAASASASQTVKSTSTVMSKDLNAEQSQKVANGG